ncbi:MAG TPA: hypothetical protein VGR21_03580, partial [Cryptosporangiaceae bacterium]|nr:hypothetical protein [Cryptosporangiaceae bacterium]
MTAMEEFDAETVVVESDRLGRAVDLPDDPRTLYGTVTRIHDHERAPIVPAWLRNPAQRRQFVGWALGYAGYVVRFHTLRAPKYAVLAVFWAIVGAFRIVGRQIRWWWVIEQHGLRQAAATRNDKDAAKEWSRLHREAQATRKFRGIVVGFEALIVVVFVLVVWRSPVWVQALAVVVVVPALAILG